MIFRGAGKEKKNNKLKALFWVVLIALVIPLHKPFVRVLSALSVFNMCTDWKTEIKQKVFLEMNRQISGFSLKIDLNLVRQD